MGREIEGRSSPPKQVDYDRELGNLRELFGEVEESKAKLVSGLMEEAAFLRAQNKWLRDRISETGMVLVHPSNPNMQKPVEAARQYLKNVNSYAVVIKTLNSVLSKNVLDSDDGLDEFE